MIPPARTAAVLGRCKRADQVTTSHSLGRCRRESPILRIAAQPRALRLRWSRFRREKGRGRGVQLREELLVDGASCGSSADVVLTIDASASGRQSARLEKSNVGRTGTPPSSNVSGTASVERSWAADPAFTILAFGRGAVLWLADILHLVRIGAIPLALHIVSMDEAERC